jgi:mycofactocin system glycosyltransferase
MTTPFDRFRLDATYRRTGPSDGLRSIILGGSPFTVFRLSEGGVRVAERIEAQLPLPDGHAALTNRLLAAGAIHPLPPDGPGPYTAADVTVVMPTLDRDVTVDHDGPMVVVDDGSSRRIDVPAGATVLRHDHPHGPGAARQAGLALVRTPLVAFVDTDVSVPAGWLDGLLWLFANPAVGLVAPRVRSAPGSSLLARYERDRSPLDLGAEPARIAAGTRVSYVPAAAIVCRMDALRSIGGFDTRLRFGEDVDLVWRLTDAGWSCRYEPDVVVEHQSRPTWQAWVRQRRDYASSTRPLAARHPGMLAPVRINRWSAGVWALVGLRRPFAAAALTAVSVAGMWRKVPGLPRGDGAALVVRGHLGAGQQLASAVRRAWLPGAVVLSMCSRRARRLTLLALLEPLLHWRPRRGVTPLVIIADDLASHR